jgi:hypothetical protein
MNTGDSSNDRSPAGDIPANPEILNNSYRTEKARLTKEAS